MSDGPAQRVFEIRTALGDGRYPLSQTKLAALLTKVSGKRYDGTMVTKMEKKTRKVSADDARWLAAVDPLQRGAAWVLCLSDRQPFTPPAGSTGHRSHPDPDAPTTPVVETGSRRGKAAGGR